MTNYTIKCQKSQIIFTESPYNIIIKYIIKTYNYDIMIVGVNYENYC